ncbi:Mov34/MPN/PAD-1 family protein [Mycoplasma todarodis]|uniref:Mov34/MPN/PAD-1 family protein n=1 Tax=Mycoplasma todarodis TaxID=1937191 RepID=UPI003B399DC6
MKISAKEFVIYIPDKFILEISKHSGKKEKIGFIIGNKILESEEYQIKAISKPNIMDISTETFSRVSWFHKRKVKRMMELNKEKIYPLGFWHTHPHWYGVKPSITDLNHFADVSKNKRKNIFVIATNDLVAIYIYEGGKCILQKKGDITNGRINFRN